jgi:hypothetical protein
VVTAGLPTQVTHVIAPQLLMSLRHKEEQEALTVNTPLVRINTIIGQPLTNIVLKIVETKLVLVELTGQRSNEFDGDLSSAIKHLDVID